MDGKRIWIISAMGDAPRAGVLGRLLGAEGAQVELLTRMLPHDEARTLPDPHCVIAVWSWKSASSSPVREIAAKALAARTLVQIALDNVRSPLTTTHAPIDFRGWTGARSGPWNVLRERIDQVMRGEEPVGAPILGVAVVGMVSASFLGIAVSQRVAVGTGPDVIADVAPFSTISETHVATLDPAAVGGPVEAPDELVPEDEIEIVRVSPPPPLHMTRLAPLPDISAPREISHVDVRGPGFIRDILNGVEDTIPFINVSDAEPSGGTGGGSASIR